MPRAAPGVSARGAVRRRLLKRIGSPVRSTVRRDLWHLYWWEMEGYLLPCCTPWRLLCTFTLNLSDYGVVHGCLGEVVSLVGDCRPPPPGNPRRPPSRKHQFSAGWERGTRRSKYALWRGFSEIKNTKHGELLPVSSKYHTFNIRQFRNNLKKLNLCQYFKKSHSFFSCARKCAVLEFDKLHSHMCGLMVVEFPSIAVTNVLES